MASNTVRSDGRLIIPMETYMLWLSSQLNVPPGTFVAFGATTFLGDRMEVPFSTATDFQPGPPAPPEATTRPA